MSAKELFGCKFWLDWFDCDSDVIVRLKSPRNKIGAPDQLYSDLNLQPNDLLLEVIF